MSAQDLLALAARGNVEAQAGMAASTLDHVLAGRVAMAEGLGAAELWGRMAASHGSTRHMLALAGILLSRAAFEEASPDDESTMLQGEAVALLSICADRGDEHAAQWLNVAVDNLGREVLEVARAYLSPSEQKEP
jgi:hypothetical protein